MKQRKSLRHLYLAVGDPNRPEAAWLEDGYPWFSRDLRTDVQPIAANAHCDPRGNYVMFGADAAGAHRLASALAEHGLEVIVRPYLQPSSLVTWLVNQPLGLSFAAVALLVAMTVAASGIANVKGYGVQRLAGASYGRLLMRDLRALAPFAAGCGATVGVAGLLAFGAYSQWHQWQVAAAWAAWLTAGMAAIAVIAHEVALRLVGAAPILASIAGRLPARGVIPAICLVRVPALVVAAAAVIVLATTAGKLADYRASASAWWLRKNLSQFARGCPACPRVILARIRDSTVRPHKGGSLVADVERPCGGPASMGQGNPT